LAEGEGLLEEAVIFDVGRTEEEEEADSFDDEDVAEEVVLVRGVVGGDVKVTADRLGLRCLVGDGVFSTSMSLSDDELLEDVVESTISLDFGAADWLVEEGFLGRPGRLVVAFSLTAVDVVDVSFFGRPRPRRLGTSPTLVALVGAGGRSEERFLSDFPTLTGRRSSSLLLSDSESLEMTLLGAGRCLDPPAPPVQRALVATDRGVFT